MADTDTGSNTPIGGNAAQNIEDLRAERGLSLRQLTELLRDLGHPMQTSAVHSLTQGRRRIDVDDLVSIALALRVNPSAILFPRHAGRDDEVQLTPEVYQRNYLVWAWADGLHPLADEIPPPGALAINTPGDKFADWVAHARPDHAAPEPHQSVAELITLQRAINTVLADPDNPETYANWRDFIIRRFRLVAIQLEELLAEFDRKALHASAFEFDQVAANAQLRDAVGEVRKPSVDYVPSADERYRAGVQSDNAQIRRPPPVGPHGAPTTVDPLDPFGK